LSSPNLPSIIYSNIESNITSRHTTDTDFTIPEEIPLSFSDTDLFISGCESVTFHENTIIITDGEFNGRVYSITRGSCKLSYFNRTRSDKILKEGAIFGHVEFLLGKNGKRMYINSVEALSEVTVTIIESYFLNILLQYYPHLAGGFLLQLAQSLHNQLKVEGGI